MNYAFEQKVKMVCGWGSLSRLPELLEAEGFCRPLLVCDGMVRQMGLAQKVTDLLAQHGAACTLFDEVQPDPPADIVDKGAKLCREAGCDCVVAIGGGSTIDTAKGINLLRANGGHILDYAAAPAPDAAGKGLISIPTTAGTGSELSNGMIVTDTAASLKLAIIEYGEFAILDPALTATMPARLTVHTGLDVFSHAFEAYTSTLSNPMADAVCEKVMEDVIRWLPTAKAEPENRTAREKMAVASSLGGWMLANACAHAGHSLAHVLGAKLHLPHGLVCSYTLPAVMEYIAPAAPEKVRFVGELLGADFAGAQTPEEAGARAAAAYRAFRDNLLGDSKCSFGLSEEERQALVPAVMGEVFAGFTPRPLTESAVRAMLDEIVNDGD